MKDRQPKDAVDLFVVVIVAVFFIALMMAQGCGTVNGIGADTENVGRFIRERTQPAVDGMEMTRFESAIRGQNRLIKRGMAMEKALQ